MGQTDQVFQLQRQIEQLQAALVTLDPAQITLAAANLSQWMAQPARVALQATLGP